MHGEYKVPGGKLVVVDLDVVDGRLVDVWLSGDFFPEPDEALANINGALSGAELAARTRRSWPRLARGWWGSMRRWLVLPCGGR
ncbi:hypothetical protein ACWDKQ_21715 [Saccharopolyspora sp. NPDC000995]